MVPKAQKYEVKMITARTLYVQDHFGRGLQRFWHPADRAYSLPRRGCRFLNTKRFPANLRLAGKQICSCHFDPVYQFAA